MDVKEENKVEHEDMNLRDLHGIGKKTAEKLSDVEDWSSWAAVAKVCRSVRRSRARTLFQNACSKGVRIREDAVEKINNLPLEEIPGIGNKIATAIYRDLGLQSVSDIDHPIPIRYLVRVDGIGPSRQKQIVEGLNQLSCLQYRTKSGLKNQRDWTDAGIRDFLGEPDKRKKNPHYSSARKMKLYDLSRVRRVEATEDFQDWIVRSMHRRPKVMDQHFSALPTDIKKEVLIEDF